MKHNTRLRCTEIGIFSMHTYQLAIQIIVTGQNNCLSAASIYVCSRLVTFVAGRWRWLWVCEHDAFSQLLNQARTTLSLCRFSSILLHLNIFSLFKRYVKVRVSIYSVLVRKMCVGTHVPGWPDSPNWRLFTFGRYFANDSSSTHFGLLFSAVKIMHLFWTKMHWATFWANFSQTHLVTLAIYTDGRCTNYIILSLETQVCARFELDWKYISGFRRVVSKHIGTKSLQKQRWLCKTFPW
jgi:hypothetical protein